METKRLAIAFALSAAVLILWSVVQQKYFPQPKRPAPSAAPTAVAREAAPATVPTAPATGATEPAKEAVSPQAKPSVAPVAGTVPVDLVVSTPLYTARVSNRGGELLSFVLERYRDARGQPLELVRKGPSSRAPRLPFTRSRTRRRDARRS